MAKTLTTTSIAVIINGNDYSKHVMFPFKVSNLLDEQLDEASLTLIGVPEKNFKPLTDVIVTLTDGNKTQSYSMLVASDKADEIPTGSGRYKHELYLIEQTKYLECFISRSIGFVNPLERSYAEIDVEPTLTTLWQDFDWKGRGNVLLPTMKTPCFPEQEILIRPLREFYWSNESISGSPYVVVMDQDIRSSQYWYTKIEIKNSENEIIKSWYYSGSPIGGIYDTPQPFVIPSTSMLSIEYTIIFGHKGGSGTVVETNCHRFLYYIAVL
jgi:hypothetical protein